MMTDTNGCVKIRMPITSSRPCVPQRANCFRQCAGRYPRCSASGLGQVGKAAEQGFQIEAVRKRGYRSLGCRPPHPTLLRLAQEQRGAAIETLYYPRIDSTNNEAERRRRSAVRALCRRLQLPDRATALGEWYSASADNLTCRCCSQQPRTAAAALHPVGRIHICRTLQAWCWRGSENQMAERPAWEDASSPECQRGQNGCRWHENTGLRNRHQHQQQSDGVSGGLRTRRPAWSPCTARNYRSMK